MERRGYIYVLATAYQDRGGQQIIKIGRTSRSPAARVKELSRGGPTGMVLVGAVTCRDAVELEKRAHRHFHQSRFRSDGGTEYFTARPNDVLDWLRTETPRFDLESARKDAWAEYIGTKPFKIQGRLILLFTIPGVLSPLAGLAGLLIKPFPVWSIFVGIVVGPVIYCALALMLAPTIRRLGYMQRLNADLELAQRELEAKYHLPTGGVRFG
jgi:hypothetical protein